MNLKDGILHLNYKITLKLLNILKILPDLVNFWIKL